MIENSEASAIVRYVKRKGHRARIAEGGQGVVIDIVPIGEYADEDQQATVLSLAEARDLLEDR